MGKEYNRKLVLENGDEFYGYGFGCFRQSISEIVFNTSMVGYQEMLTDPSCAAQMVVMTYPIIGSYGMTDEDNESRMPVIDGLIVREYNDNPSNFRYTKTLSEAMEEYGIPGISGIDTRKLTKVIRDEGSQKAMITSPDKPAEKAVAEMKAYELPTDAVAAVSCRKKWYSRTTRPQLSVVAIDCGIKMGIVKKLNQMGCNVTVVPYNTSAEEILSLHPDGLLVSNGPGDPQNAPDVIETIKALRGKLPMFGICLGHQLICLAYGATTYKLKFGHRGGNHPVKNLKTGLIEITSQGHNHAVDIASAEGTDLEITHINLLDGSVEGAECTKDKVFSVQYHPESCPGPQDSIYLFDKFIKLMSRED